MSNLLPKLFAIAVMVALVTVTTYFLHEQSVEAGVGVNPLTSGLVGYWNFNDGASTQAADISITRNNGTLTSMADPPTGTSGWGTGHSGKGLNFDGSDDFVNIPTATAYDSAVGTWSAWIKPRSLSAASQAFIARADSSSSLNGITLNTEIGTPGLRLTVKDGVGSVCNINVGDIADLKWHLVTVVWTGANGGTDRLYVDGVEVGSCVNSAAWNFNSQVITVGKSSDAGMNKFPGTIDDVRVYNRQLSADEVATLYRSSLVLYNTPSKNGLVGYWNFDEATSTQADDLSDTRNHGTLTSMANPPTSSSGWTQAGRMGPGLNFDGSDDFVNVPSSTAYDSTVGTWAIWVKVRGFAGGSSAIFMGRTDSSGSSYGIHMFYDGVNVGAGMKPDSGYVCQIYTPITRGEWYHVALTWSQVAFGGANLYVNGVDKAVCSVFPGWSFNGDVLTFGKSIDGFWTKFDGYLDDARIYNRKLSPTEIASLYQAGAAHINANQNRRFTSGLVGLWSFNGADVDWRANKAIDRSGNNYHGTFENLPTSTAPAMGKVGQAMQFATVTSDRITLGQQAGLSLTGEMTACAWFNTRSVAATGQGSTIIVNHQSGTANQNYKLEINRTAGRLSTLWAGSVILTGSTALSANTWYHGCVVRSGSSGNWTARLYLNGVQDGVAATATNPTGGTLDTYIGEGNPSADESSFDGSIDEVRLYDRALSATEVKLLYSSG